MDELRVIYTRGPNDGDEEIHFTEDEGDEAGSWAKPDWEVIFDTVVQTVDAVPFPGSFPSENSFTRTS